MLKGGTSLIHNNLVLKPSLTLACVLDLTYLSFDLH